MKPLLAPIREIEIDLFPIEAMKQLPSSIRQIEEGSSIRFDEISPIVTDAQLSECRLREKTNAEGDCVK
ncbi:MAG: hypothetical protein AAGF31_13640 [Planctomycetota bacterium]